MPVQKFNTFAEAEKSLWNFNPDEHYYRSVSDLFKVADKLNPVVCERGVHKFKSLKEAQIHRMAGMKR